MIRKAFFQSVFANRVEILTVRTKAGLNEDTFSPAFALFSISYRKNPSQIPLVFAQKTICENRAHPVYSGGSTVEHRCAESGQKGPFQAKTHSDLTHRSTTSAVAIEKARERVLQADDKEGTDS